MLELFGIPVGIYQIEYDQEFYKTQALDTTKKVGSTTISNVGGYQSIAADVHNWVNFKELTTEIENIVRMETGDGISISESWLNINKKDNSNKIHDHWGTDNIVKRCAVFYINANERSGDLVLHNPMLTRYLNGKNKFPIKPKNGMLVTFPSWLPHEVYCNDTEEDRISIAFNFTKSGES